MIEQLKMRTDYERATQQGRRQHLSMGRKYSTENTGIIWAFFKRVFEYGYFTGTSILAYCRSLVRTLN